MTASGDSADVADFRRAVLERFERKLDRYLPTSGATRQWTISTIEDALASDMLEVAQDVIESCIAVDPLRRPAQNPRCPDCGRSLVGTGLHDTHKKTIFGPIRYSRAYGSCPACRRAFSPSGQRVVLRQGLL